ncbi:MAG: metal-dependent hydrolase [Elusimicrobiota bacterium]
MDPLTHALVGAVAGKSVHASNKRFWIMIGLSLFPDIDIVFSFFGSWASAFQHRGISHSLFGLIAQTFIFAWALKKWDEGPFRKRFLGYGLVIGLHSLCDFMTIFGVPLLLPFSFQEFSLDWVQAFTFIPILFMGFGLYWLNRKKGYGWKGTKYIWFAWVIYLGASLSAKIYAQNIMINENILATALPRTVNPFQWRGVETDTDHKMYRTYIIDLFRRNKSVDRTFSMPKKKFPVTESLSAPLAKNFFETARWPVARVNKFPEGWQVEWGTLLFSSKGLVRGKVRVVLSPTGDVVSQERIFNFWNPEVINE